MAQPVRLVLVFMLMLGGCSLLSPSTDKTRYLDHYMQECASLRSDPLQPLPKCSRATPG